MAARAVPLSPGRSAAGAGFHPGRRRAKTDEIDAAAILRFADAIEADTALARRAALLRTIPGVGAVTAATLVAEVPELGTTGNKQIAALTGVAPMNRDSGRSRGQAHIAGDRLSARCCLYTAIIVAIRCNPVAHPFYKHLRLQGKPPKVAIVAAMRKLVTIASSMLAHDRPWQNHPA